MVPAALSTDVEALDQQNAPGAERLQSRLRDIKAHAPRELETSRFETDDVMRIIARATGKFGEPFPKLIVYQRLRPRASGTAASLDETAKLVALRQSSGLESCRRRACATASRELSADPLRRR